MDENRNNGTVYDAQPQQAQQPQYQYQQQPQQQQQPQYNPQPQYTVYPQYPQYAPADYSKQGKGGGWIMFMRVLTWILFAIVEIAMLVSGVVMIAHDSDLVGVGLLTIVVGTFFAFVMIAGTMIFLDLAKNVKNIASNTADANTKLDEISRKLDR